MGESRIRKIDHVVLESHPEAEGALRWFYGKLVRLEELPPKSAHGSAPRMLCFRSVGIELRVRLVPAPVVEAMACRVRLAVGSLTACAKALDEKRIEYEWLHGSSWTDQMLTLLDPGGNRVALIRDWPQVPF